MHERRFEERISSREEGLGGEEEGRGGAEEEGVKRLELFIGHRGFY